MKLIFLDPNIFTVKILRADSISSSVLNRIKRDWAGSTTKNRIRRSIKIYNSQKQRISKIITDIVKNIDTILIAKEIVSHSGSLTNTEYTVDKLGGLWILIWIFSLRE